MLWPNVLIAGLTRPDSDIGSPLTVFHAASLLQGNGKTNLTWVILMGRSCRDRTLKGFPDRAAALLTARTLTAHFNRHGRRHGRSRGKLRAEGSMRL